MAVARLTTIEHFAPLGGLSHRQLREEALADAADVARQTAQLIGGHLCVEHCATESWRTLIGLVQGEGHDLLIVAEPKRWRDRWLLARAFRHDPERRLMRL